MCPQGHPHKPGPILYPILSHAILSHSIFTFLFSLTLFTFLFRLTLFTFLFSLTLFPFLFSCSGIDSGLDSEIDYLINNDDYENTDAEFSLIGESGWNDYPRQRFTTTTRKGKYGVTKKLARTRQGTINKASQRLILKIADLSRVLNFFKLFTN